MRRWSLWRLLQHNSWATWTHKIKRGLVHDVTRCVRRTGFRFIERTKQCDSACQRVWLYGVWWSISVEYTHFWAVYWKLEAASIIHHPSSLLTNFFLICIDFIHEIWAFFLKMSPFVTKFWLNLQNVDLKPKIKNIPVIKSPCVVLCRTQGPP